MAWTMKRNEMIETALREIGSVNLNANPTNKMYQLGADAINQAIEELHNDGLTLLQVLEDEIDTALAINTLDADIEDVLDVWVELSSNSSQPLMKFLTRAEYSSIADKESQGTPYNVLVQYSNPRKLLFWPAPNATYKIKFNKVVKIASLDSATSTVEFEKRYYGALIAKTAAILATRMNRPDNIITRTELLADKKIEAARGREIRSQSRNTMAGAYNSSYRY